MARFPLNTMAQKRPCGACQACCAVVGVVELAKDQWQHCPNQCDQGCAIYEDRPATCSGYYCLWALGWIDGDERRRPDRLGVIFDWRSYGEILTGETGAADTPVIQVQEVWPGALGEPNVQWLTQRLAERYVLALRPYGSKQVEFVDHQGALG